MVEKSDEFDEWILNRQNFPYQNFALKIFVYTIYNYFEIRLWSLSHYVGAWNFEALFHPILDKKVPPEDKELYSIHLGYYLRFARKGYI